MIQEAESIELQVTTFYKIISGKAAEIRDWSKFKDLFFEDSNLSICKRDDNSRPAIARFTIDEYIKRLQSFLSQKDFFEASIKNDIRIYGDICMVCNEYEAFADSEKKKFLKKGKNLITMASNGTEWKFVSMLWEDDV